MSKAVPSLLATPACARERDFLHNLFSESGWEVHQAQTFQEVLTAVQGKPIGVLLSDRRFSDGHCWKDLLEEIQRLESPPMLIVTDRLADERLWAEVLNLGAYDLLLKPFDPEELLRVVSSAWASWKFSRDGPTAGGESAKWPSPEQPKAPIGGHSAVNGLEGIKSHA